MKNLILPAIILCIKTGWMVKQNLYIFMGHLLYHITYQYILIKDFNIVHLSLVWNPTLVNQISMELLFHQLLWLVSFRKGCNMWKLKLALMRYATEYRHLHFGRSMYSANQWNLRLVFGRLYFWNMLKLFKNLPLLWSICHQYWLKISKELWLSSMWFCEISYTKLAL